MRWRPIETAPKDRPLLVYGQWAGEIAGVDVEPKWAVAFYTGRGDYEGFHWACANTDAYAAWMKPTHWMPLPRAPIDTPPKILNPPL